jgi:acyl transferase domain-containing protein
LIEVSRAGRADDLAIIGMACRVPGARNTDEFWSNLREAVESISFFTDAQLMSGIDSCALKDRRYVKAKGLLEDAEFFDASFFGFTPNEATLMDPQHRVFLECAWEALEDAGYNSQAYDGRIGVFAGASTSMYSLKVQANPQLMGSMGDIRIRLATDKDFLPAWVSYKLDLTGPSIAVQTACSTSLVAIHLACASLLNGECDVALAGGVTISLPERTGYFYQEGGILSPDGHCRAFDANAQGTVPGNGVGIVVLKRLREALVQRDSIYAIIKGSAVNNDGSLKVGFTAPGVDGQSAVICDALAVAGVRPETIAYIETHGTGTALGDLIEIAALKEVFQASDAKTGCCALGSVKTSIGHLDAAAGVASLIKTVLALQNRLLPPALNFQCPSPGLELEGSPFYVNTAVRQWQGGAVPRRAGVSSFGMGGTNAHVILEEAPPAIPPGASRPWHILVFSAKSGSAVDISTANLIGYLEQHPDLNIADIAYTLQIGRRAFSHRRMLICRDVEDAVSALRAQDPSRVISSTIGPEPRPVVFMFGGPAAAYVNMGRELYKVEETFREDVDHWSELVKTRVGIDLRPALYPGDEHARRQMSQTPLAGLALFAIQYALARLWIHWGVNPEAMVGDSVGEFLAACLAGVFSLEDAAELVTCRAACFEESAKRFSQHVRGIALAAPRIRFLSNLTGTCITSAEAMDPGYWEQQLRQPPRIAASMLERPGQPDSLRLHVGPAGAGDEMTLSSLRQQENHGSDVAFLLETLGRLWLAGTPIDWCGFYTREQRRRLRLPTYPFERRCYSIREPVSPCSPAREEAACEQRAQPAPLQPVADDAHVLATSAIEDAILGIWRRLFGVEQVDIHDGFIEMGGDSLLAIELVAALRDAFGVEIPMSTLVAEETVSGLAKVIAARQAGRGDIQALEGLLTDIEGLSPDEVRQKLAAQPLSHDPGRRENE